jgi:hypothetical protein
MWSDTSMSDPVSEPRSFREHRTRSGEVVPLLPLSHGPPPPPPPDVLLVLRPRPDAVPADRRLAQLLKVALRRFKLRCVRCENLTPPDNRCRRSD